MQNPPNYTPNPAPGGSGGVGKSSTGMDANVAALLSYIFTWLTGLIFFLIEKESRYVRFHAMQAILLGVAFIIIWFVLNFILGALLFSSVTAAGLFGMIFASGTMAGMLGMIMMLIWLAFLGIIILCCVKAYQGQMFKLPIIGDMAERFSAK